MKLVLFYQSFTSCWNHGNAHFLRGVARELIGAGHHVSVYEPADGWSRMNALEDGGAHALQDALHLVPGVTVHSYRAGGLDIERAVDGADAVIVHEWNPPELVAAVGRQRRGARFTLLFHDTHHRAVTAPHELEQFGIEDYDGVLVFGEVLREVYRRRGWGRSVFTWHEAADATLFRPLPNLPKERDLVWIGNWGDGERADELDEFLIEPVSQLGLSARIHGVRYPQRVCEQLAARGIEYSGWLPNHCVPDAFARARFTVHVPRRPYVETLPGIPTIRMFEALACGIPLVCSPWRDVEGLFPPGSYIPVETGTEMAAALSLILRDADLAEDIVHTGLRAIRARHTCAHRVAELLAIITVLQGVAKPSNDETRVLAS